MSNAGFELGLTDWNTFSGSSTITTDAFEGNNALQLSEARSGVGQSFNAIPGETYTLSGYGKTSDTAWNGFSLRFIDQNGTLIEKYNASITGQEWQEYLIEAIAPANTSLGFFSIWKSGDTGTTEVDELTVTDTPPPLPPEDDSLLTNFSFEDDLTAWNGFSGTEQISTTDAFSGTQSLELIQGRSGANQAIDINPGETYELSAYAKTTNNAWVGLGIRFRDSNGNPLETNQSRINTSDWGLYEIVGTAPANASRAEVFIWNGGTSGSTYLDAVSLQQITGEQSNQAPTIVSNGGQDNAPLFVAENSNAIANIDATDLDGDTEGNGLTYTLEGPDINQISIDSNTGELRFNATPDFENPADSNGDNQYEVSVVVTDSQGAQDSQQLAITLTNEVSIFLLGGQSNMAGLASNNDLPSNLLNPYPAVQIWQDNIQDFSNLRPGFGGQGRDGDPGASGNGNQFGPELTFGRSIDGVTPEEVYLIKYARNGTSLASDWNPNGANNADYNAFNDRGSVALSELDDQNIGYSIEGMLWMQGERDTRNGSFANAYEVNLTVFISDMRDRYGSDMRFVIGKLSPSFSGAVPTAQEAVAAADVRNYIVNTDNFELLPDQIHYSADGTIDLGVGFATAIRDTFAGGVE